MRFPKVMFSTALAIGVGVPVSAFADSPPVTPTEQLPAFLQYNETITQLVVKFRGNERQRTGRSSQQILDAATRSLLARGAPVSLHVARTLAMGPELVTSSRSLTRAEADMLAATLSGDPDVAYAQIDELAYPASNDTYWAQQWWLQGPFGVNIAPAWAATQGEGTVVAVLDTGSFSHPDIDAKRLPGYDFMSNTKYSQDGDGRDADPTASDGCAHGMQVESTVAAVTNNQIGIAGVAPGAKVIPVRVIACDTGTFSDIAEAVIWASGAPVPGIPLNHNPAEVINLSLTAGTAFGCAQYVQDAIDIATARGTIIVAAVGNSYGQNGGNYTPANCDNVIAAGAIDQTGDKADFSNGPKGVDLWAPGTEIVLPNAWGNYYQAKGTSFAAPIIAGAVALLQAQRVRSPAEAEAILRHTAHVAPWGGHLIDVGTAVAMQQGSKNLPYVPLQFVLDADGLACLQRAGLGQRPTRSQCLPVGNAQMWAVDGASNVGYTFRSRAANSGCLATSGGSAVIESACDNGSKQRWDAIITSHASGRYVGRLRNRASGQCLTFAENLAVERSCNEAQTVWVMREHTNRIPQQGGNLFHGVHAATGGVCIGHNGNVVSLHDVCSHYSWKGKYAHTGFKLHPLDAWSDGFRITGANANQCLTVVNLTDGWSAAMRACTGDRWQQWSLVATDTHWQLRNVGNGQCLTPKGGGMATGTHIVVASCASTSNNMRWALAGLR